MDDIGNIVYVIAVIGYLIYRVVGGGKKKPAQQPANATKRKSTTIEDILSELNEKFEPETVQEERRSDPVEARAIPSAERIEPHRGHRHDEKPFLDVDNPHVELPADYQMSSSEMGSHRIQRKEVKIKEAETENPLSEYINELSEGVDLRRAIIYQTILETPYIQRV